MIVSGSTIANADEKLVDLVKKVKPSVVLIETFDKDNEPIGQGSGFFIDNNGYFVTNYHVIEGAYTAKVKTITGKEYPVNGIVAKDVEADIVKLSVDITDGNVIPLKLSSYVPTEGEDVVVIGNPLGLESSVSTGIVSAVRDIPAFGKILQITAPVSPGSSGSPVINTKGEVIGIATLIFTEGQNLNFAIPSDKIIALKETSKTQIFEAQTSYDFEKYHDKIFTVVNVVDGDTIDIDVPDGEYEHTRISLWGIDTPETQSPQTGVTYFGPEAAAFTRQLVLGRKVTIYLDTENRTRDKYSRLLAYVQLPDGRFLNEVLLAEGFAYADMRFKHTFYHKYQQLEAAARSQRKGLWANVKSDKISNEFTTDENDHNSDAVKSFLYHNPEGHFFLTIPAGWEEIPRDAIEATFRMLQEKLTSKAVANSQNYDGAFQKTSTTYFTYPYALFAIDKSGRWPEREIAKFLTSDEWEKGMQEGLRTAEKQLSGLIQNVKSGQTIYDKKRNMLFSKFESEVVGIGEVIGLTFTIPSNYGCINLYCYSTKDSFENDLPYFTQIVDSFRYDVGYAYSQVTKTNYDAKNASGRNLLATVSILLICGILVTLMIIIIAKKSAHKLRNANESKSEIQNIEDNMSETKQVWEKAVDHDVIKAATEDWTEYPPYAQTIIEAEARNRGLWEKVLYLRGEKINEPISKEGNLKGYICEGCKGTYLNFETGRCIRCELPSNTMGYCSECDKFWSLQPGQMCPEHGIKLGRHKNSYGVATIWQLHT